MNITVNEISRNKILNFQYQYYQQILVPIDDYWENVVIAAGTYYEIITQRPIGYLAIDENRVLLQFFLYADRENEDEIFEDCIYLLQIEKAYASTYEPKYLNICLDHGNDYETLAFFYKDDRDIHIEKPIENLVEKAADFSDLEDAMEYSGVEGASVDWLKHYYLNLIKNKSLYLYYLENRIIGSGELRPSHISKGASNIGMTVSAHFRKRNIGTYILYRMKTLSKEMNLIPVCGTDIDNIASQKTIQKCGFYPYHRALEIKLKNTH
ncbi:MAG: GNAT family N-acetyltransferase [Clostridiales bacterium]|nr:GNAT family N-acetyltransferase [Clostridiales bacterium]